MAKKSKKSVVWIWRDDCNVYCVSDTKPVWDPEYAWDKGAWDGDTELEFCERRFERMFPFFKMPPNSLGKITNDGKDLTFEIVETK